MTMRRVYLDSNATTPILPEVFEAMRPFFFEEGFGNASSIHQYGQRTRAAVERARESVALLFGCRAAEVVFTSGGTEGDNLALFGLTRPGDHVITSSIEHPAVLKSCEHLRQLGCEVTAVPVDGQCQVSPDDVRRALRPQTRLISIMMANNEIGVLQPVNEIGKIAAEAGVHFHTDAVQAAGRVPIDVLSIGCDLLSISGHKLHAPQGVGAIYVGKGALLNPILHGGGQERGRRSGTENVPGIVALGKAAEIAREGLANGANEQLRQWRDRLEQAVLEKLEATGVNGREAPRVSNTSSIYFDYIEGEALVIALDLKGVAASSGAACSSGAVEPSHVLTAMGLDGARARASLRFSFGKHNRAEDLDHLLSVLPDALGRLRDLSPLYKKSAVSL
jgi:cysteine desulfurase